ncbi:septation protein SepH [Umezawaea sp. NPDC059074]|uniref:septation protein SepH n=1 Tax=Umezawaea sp. NPDC059074 TaxID=3346716 RepID=UPI00367E0F1E
MRALRVIGLDEDGKSVICEDPSGGERFLLPADERLRAAARGDLTRLGQIQIEVESQMRPREIQARIRAGESVDQVAAASGLPAHRVERYAYPVLLERSRTADLAQRAHPVREDGPDVQTLGEVVAHSFGLRGQDYTDVGWDSWRGEDGKWVVQMHWTAGRSDNIAHWAFHPGAHGGTVTALDEAAVDLMDPNPNRTLRTVRPVTQLARQALEAQTPVQAEVEPEILAKEEPAPPAPVVPEQPVSEPEPVVVDAPPAVEAPVRKEPPKRGKKTHPIVPSWEDVLLGVRSHRG